MASTRSTLESCRSLHRVMNRKTGVFRKNGQLTSPFLTVPQRNNCSTAITFGSKNGLDATPSFASKSRRDYFHTVSIVMDKPTISDDSSSFARAAKLAVHGIDNSDELKGIAKSLPTRDTLPINRSSSPKTSYLEETKAQKNTDGSDTRFKAKMLALTDAKLLANRARRAYTAAVNGEIGTTDTSEEAIVKLKEEWVQTEQHLSRAYSQAIKYVARTREMDAASRAEKILNEMVARTGAPPTQYPLEDDGTMNNNGVAASTKLKRNVMEQMLRKKASASLTLPDITENPFVPPTHRDFRNVLHSWASSKARRKGLHAEALLLRMAELSWWYPDIFSDTFPDSKSFSLVVKCFAGSTHPQALKKILHLHELHRSYADAKVVGIVDNDPFFLIHSFKTLKNYRKTEEAELAELWLNQLHSFVMDPKNNSYADSDDPASKVDLTGTYSSIIRSYAQLRGQEGAAAKAKDILEKMHQILEASRATKESETVPANVATVDIKTNCYNLVLSSFRDTKQERYAAEALALLERMVQTWRNQSNVDAQSNEYTDAPTPNAQSFELCIEALAHIQDQKVLSEESERLLLEYEEMVDSAAEMVNGEKISPTVHNTLIEIYAKRFMSRPDLIEKVDKIIARMTSLSVKYPAMTPDVNTRSLYILVCSVVQQDEQKKEALLKAENTFKILKDAETKDPESNGMVDKSYFHMMKAVINLEANKETKEERITEVFKEACQKGLVNANVLKAFKNQVSEDTFMDIAGSGRLADHWIANVKSSKAIYTDGSMGGAGKHARRKGKSTSDWAKKQRKKENVHKERKGTKLKKKAIKKEKMTKSV